MKKFECPHCGFVKVLGGRELRKFRKRLSGFTCTNCGKGVSSYDLAKKRGKGPKPPGERKKRVKKEGIKEKPKALVPLPYTKRSEWRSKPLQPMGRTLGEVVQMYESKNQFETASTQVEEYLSTTKAQVGSGGSLSALTTIGLTQQEMIEEVWTEKPPRELEVIRELDMDLYLGFRCLFLTLRIDLLTTVEHLPKDARRLNQMQTKYLKEQLKELGGYDRIGGFRTAFIKFSALKNRSYGNVFYFSSSTNPWERVYRVMVDDLLLLEMKEPIKKLRGWGRSIYDPIIDQFLECGHDLVEINVEKRKPNYVASQLRRRIGKRGLKISASSVGDFIYLENNKR